MDIVTEIGIVGAVVATVDCLKDINPLYRRKKAEMDVYIDIYKDQLKTSLNEIPEKNRQEPKNSIIWPALESSIFYLENEEYRKMFAKLITSACDARKNANIHACFLEIIKQMDPLDAHLISLFKHNFSLPIIELRALNDADNSIQIELSNCFLTNTLNEKLDSNASAITNLDRLGLIKIDFTSWLTDDDRYSIYRNHPDFVIKKKNIVSNYKLIGTGIKDLTIGKGLVSLTPLGEDFIEVCIE